LRRDLLAKPEAAYIVPNLWFPLAKKAMMLARMAAAAAAASETPWTQRQWRRVQVPCCLFCLVSLALFVCLLAYFRFRKEVCLERDLKLRKARQGWEKQGIGE
jgi:hypothetical protein